MTSWLPLVRGATAKEAVRPYPADGLVPEPALRMTRAVGVAAPAALTWPWLCQLAVAQYSYDLVDNPGRRSPQELTPGVDELELGQPLAVVFRLVSFDAHASGSASPPSADGGSSVRRP